MSTVVWKGTALAVAQVQSYAFAGTWEADDLVRVTIGSKTTDITAGSTTVATIVDNVVSAFNALDPASYPEMARITASRSSTSLLLTADDPGVPFTCTITPLEANTGAADSQTIEGAGAATTGTASTASAGPNDWSTAANWSGGAVPVNSDDVYLENSSVPILYGLSQSGVTLTSLNLAASYTGTVGLPEQNDQGYYEYRTSYLTISATTINVGDGPGQGSGRIKINTGTNVTTVNVRATAPPIETGRGSLLWKGTHASNVVNVVKGNVGIAQLAGETATVATLRVGYVTSQDGDSTVYLGTGVTLTTVSQTGGDLTVQSNCTTISRTGGTLHHRAGTVTTLTSDGGTAYLYGTGTITTQNVGGGATHDFGRDMRAETVTNTNLYQGGALLDPFARVTFTNGIVCVRCALPDVTLDVGNNRTLTPS